jgi:hypothetical protein
VPHSGQGRADQGEGAAGTYNKFSTDGGFLTPAFYGANVEYEDKMVFYRSAVKKKGTETAQKGVINL